MTLREARYFICLTLLLSFGACSVFPKTPTFDQNELPESTATVNLNIKSKADPKPNFTSIPQLVITQVVTLQAPEAPYVPLPTSSGELPIPTSFRFSDGQYLDERGSEYQFLISYFNTIRQNLLPMAYYFWNDEASLAGSYESFVQSHSNLKPDEISILKVGSSGTAGSIYTIFGLVINGSLGESPTTWAGCYIIRRPDPALFDSKDYQPLHFIAGRLIEVPVGETPKAAMESACARVDFGLLEVTIQNSDSPESVDAKYYIDGRSDPAALISSFWNALNRQEYARAYSYFEAPAIFPGPYLTFKAGYLDTRNVTGHISDLEKLAATGNWYWKVPVVMHAETKSGIQQAFVGCYVVHQSDPELYVSPPFKPMGIQKARFEAIEPAADTQSIEAALGIACDGLP